MTLPRPRCLCDGDTMTCAECEEEMSLTDVLVMIESWASYTPWLKAHPARPQPEPGGFPTPHFEEPIMVKVKFNSANEFVAELRLDAGDVERQIVRVTTRWRRDAAYPTQSLAVVATYVAAGQLVMLEGECGTFLPGLQEEQDVRGRRDAKLDGIVTAAKELGLEVRAGVFE